MKKVILIVVALLAVGGGAAFLLTRDKKNDSGASNSGTSASSGSYKIMKACDAFTLEDAKVVLGADAQTGISSPDNSTDDLNVSTCTFTNPANAGATLLARSAKTKTGADSNAKQFATLPEGATAVTGYGDKAYYEPTYGQLNILKNSNWYILSNGGIRPTDKTIELAKKMADQIISKL